MLQRVAHGRDVPGRVANDQVSHTFFRGNMANLALKNGIFLVRFRFQGNEFKRSLKTRSQRDADISQKLVELTIHRMLTGQLQLPAGVDVGEFIVSGGTRQPPVAPAPDPVFPTTRELIARYLAAKEHTISSNYLLSQKIHLNHLAKFLGEATDKPCHGVTQHSLENYLLGRLKIRDPQTVARERVTLQQFYKWIASRQEIPDFPSPCVGLPVFKSSKDRDRFRTIAETEALIERGGLSAEQQASIWDALYLNLEEIAGLLALVRERARNPLSNLLHAIPAYTGMRRGEVLRLQWLDVDFEGGYITARSRKQSRTRAETKRQIDLHPELKQQLLDWRKRQAKGQWVLGDRQALAQLKPDQANRLFRQPMRGTTWCLDGSKGWFKIGFHTYRHSFASNLAGVGVDQRVIDRWMGHQTEEMRRRYQHLFPRQMRSAIECFSLLTSTSGS